ncbi:unnamed protein product [Vitrella brassicaformis CCMP3155]|uniref:GH18 domain-containing protein n=1 Tax=Vitrella brassicaformis (strain CCMP3155) TaxID=1169540 RepID=A0A0G4GCI1_VITBC|nr:unnamed protein product [Vitrella brassicaformis CCMP3155]|eukprot:CEM26497.1 unnamed protein product [Vitrella brassicaformis CCMP3155]
MRSLLGFAVASAVVAARNLLTSAAAAALPSSRLLIGYASWAQCDDKVIQAVEEGVNVVIWFSIDLAVNETTGRPEVFVRPDLDCIAEKAAILKEKGLETTHLISIGGWNSPHPDTSNTAKDVYLEFDRWNREDVARGGFGGFDGIDWDVEGNDDLSSPFNELTAACIKLMGEMSQLAKRDGYITIRVSPSQLVVGLICDEVIDSDRMLYLSPKQVVEADKALTRADISVRGYGYWNMQCDGVNTGVRLSAGLNAFLHTRKGVKGQSGSSWRRTGKGLLDL